MVNEYDFGVLKVLRKKQELSLEKLAAKTGLAYSTLALIEGNKRIPSLDTLGKLAGAFALPVEHLLSLAFRNHVQIRRAQPATDELKSNDPRMETFSIAQFNDCKVFHWVGKAGRQIHAPQSHPNCPEITYLIRGSLRAGIEGCDYILAAGDAILFDGTLNHSYTVLEDAEAVCVHIPRTIHFL
jgi:transcriptional regulator with XRE-family HTH domain